NVGAAGATFNFSSSTPFRWLGGTIKAGTSGLTNTGTLNIGQANSKSTETLFGVLVNTSAGTITQAGTSTLKTSAGSVLNNQGTYNLVLDNSATTPVISISGNGLSGSGTLINSGTFQKSTGVAKVDVATIASSVPFNNVGGTV